MKILQVSHVFMPESAGGTEVHTYLLSKALQVQHEVAVCYRIFDKERPEHELVKGEYDGIPVYKIVNNFSWSQGPDFDFFDPGQEQKFQAVLDAVQPDVVHFQHLGGGLSTSLPSLVRARGIPMMLTLHDFWPMCHLSHLFTPDCKRCIGPEGGLRCVQCWLRNTVEQQVSVPRRIREVGIRNALKMAPRFLLDRFGLREYLPPVAYHTTRLMSRDNYFRQLLQQFDVLLAPSRHLRERYIRWGIDPERIRFVQNGISPEKFANTPRELPLGDTLQAVYIGSILANKGLDVLIGAFNQLIDVPVQLKIYGNTNSNRWVKHYAHALRTRNNNPKVTFEGPFPNQEIGKVLAGADFAIVPSILYENCPMVILEALYAGRPVVTSNVGGMAELVQNEVNGLTFRVGDAGDLQEKVRFLAANRDTLSQFQQQIAPPNSMEDVTHTVAGYYQQLVVNGDIEE